MKRPRARGRSIPPPPAKVPSGHPPRGAGEGEGLFPLALGTPVVLYLQDPREKAWGLLVSIASPGIVLRGLDLRVFDDWMRQEARGNEPVIGLTTIFYPMNRVERMERDESFGPLISYADRFLEQVGRTVGQVAGLEE